jgi:septation ring formation regulator EzrA
MDFVKDKKMYIIGAIIIVVIIVIVIAVIIKKKKDKESEESKKTESFTNVEISKVYNAARKYLKQGTQSNITFSAFNEAVGDILTFVQFMNLQRVADKPGFSKRSVVKILSL